MLQDPVEGPYPEEDRAAELEYESRVALLAALPINRFRFRDEAGKDSGIDGSIELKVNGKSLNVRSQVQLKATDSTKLNSDGSASREVSVANLNALLNGPSGIYVLHINPLNELRYTWAWDERKRLDRETPGWEKQKTVTLRFSTVLDAASCDEIWDRIYRENQVQRQAREAILAAGTLGTATLTIDLGTLEVMSGDQALRALESEGNTLVSKGEAVAVLKLLSRLGYKQRERAIPHLMAGYACAALGRYVEALGHLARARLQSRELDKSDQEFLNHLTDSCQLCTGQLEVSEYIRRQEEVAYRSDSEFALMLRLEAARRRSFAGGEEGMLALRKAVESIVASPKAGARLRFQADLVLLQQEARELSDEVRERSSQLASRQALGIDPGYDDEMRAIVSAMMTWETRVQKVLEDPRVQLNKTFEADVLSARAFGRFLYLSSAAVFNLDNSRKTNDFLGEDIDKALDLYTENENLEGQLRTRMLQANVKELDGDIEAARSIAAEVLPQVEAIGYQSMVENARDILEGRSMLARARVAHEMLANTDQDFLFAKNSDEDLESFARHTLTTLRLPVDRLPGVLESIRGERELARVQVDWCRHFTLLQRLGHTRAAETAYRGPLQWSCACHLKGVRPEKDDCDFVALIADFKTTHCAVCTLRSPKNDH